MRDLLTKISHILNKTGTFSNFVGPSGQKIGSYYDMYNNYHTVKNQGYLAKEVIQQLSPKKGWENSKLTTLETKLSEQKNKKIQINSCPELGKGSPSISLSTLQDLANSSKLIVNPNVLPKAAFLKLQHNLKALAIRHQDPRSLYQILQQSGQLENWRNSWKDLGFKDQDHFNTIAQMPIMLISSSICHSQQVHFLVEEHLHGQEARNKVRNENLDGKTPCVVISAPGINFAYSGKSINEKQLIQSGLARMCISNMWENILEASISQGCKYISIPPIGLGAFAGTDPNTVAEIYFDTLFELLEKKEYEGKFDGIFYNPRPKHFSKCKEVLARHQKKIDCPVNIHLKDSKFLAINLAQADYVCAVVNPSDMDAVLGLNDIGEYYKSGDYAMEEDIVATSTAFIGSAQISGAYNDPNRIKNSTGHNNLQSTVNTIQKVYPKPDNIQQQVKSKKRTNKSVTIYSANTYPRKVALKFDNKEERENFMKQFHKKASELGVNIRLTFHYENLDTLYFEPSGESNEPGTYVSSNGQLAIAFGNNQLRDFFINELGSEVKQHSDIPNTNNNLYFHTNVLPHYPNRQKNIVTTLTDHNLQQKHNLELKAPTKESIEKIIPQINTSQTIIIYSAKPDILDGKDDRRVALRFGSKKNRDLFKDRLLLAAKNLNIHIPMSTIPENSTVFYIDPSINGFGTYQSNDGKLSINFGNKQLRDFFINELGTMLKDTSEIPNDNTLCFNKDALPPEPNKSKSIFLVAETNNRQDPSKLKPEIHLKDPIEEIFQETENTNITIDINDIADDDIIEETLQTTESPSIHSAVKDIIDDDILGSSQPQDIHTNRHIPITTNRVAKHHISDESLFNLSTKDIVEKILGARTEKQFNKLIQNKDFTSLLQANGKEYCAYMKFQIQHMEGNNKIIAQKHLNIIKQIHIKEMSSLSEYKNTILAALNNDNDLDNPQKINYLKILINISDQKHYDKLKWNNMNNQDTKLAFIKETVALVEKYGNSLSKEQKNAVWKKAIFSKVAGYHRFGKNSNATYLNWPSNKTKAITFFEKLSTSNLDPKEISYRGTNYNDIKSEISNVEISDVKDINSFRRK